MLNPQLADVTAYDELPVAVQRNHRWNKVGAVLTGNHDGRATLHIGDEGVRSAEINSDNAVVGHSVLRQGLIYVAHQVADVGAAVEQVNHFVAHANAGLLCADWNQRIPFIPVSLQFGGKLAELL